jgi:hypothetical protein
MSKVWVAQLDMRSPGFSGTWLTVHGSRESARRMIAERADIHNLYDLWRQADSQDYLTESEVASSALAKDGEREITWVINRHSIEDPVLIISARLSDEIPGEVVVEYSDGTSDEIILT